MLCDYIVEIFYLKKKLSCINIGRYVMVMSVIFEGIKRYVDLCIFIMLNVDL